MRSPGLTPDQVRAVAARLCPPKAAPEPEPVRHWGKVQAILAAGPATYRDVATGLRVSIYHANQILRRLRSRGLVEAAEEGRPPITPTFYRLTTTRTHHHQNQSA